MSENFFYCKCGFKCVEGQLAKNNGDCPKCKNSKHSLKAKYQEVA